MNKNYNYGRTIIFLGLGGGGGGIWWKEAYFLGHEVFSHL